MLSIKIEKEIKHEQPIVFGLTVRKTICVGLGIAAAVLLYAVTGASVAQLIPSWVFIAVIAGAFGWVEKDGAHLEDYLLKKIKEVVYKNGTIHYRTSNRYIRMLNAGYRRKRIEAEKAAKQAGKQKAKPPKAKQKKPKRGKDNTPKLREYM